MKNFYKLNGIIIIMIIAFSVAACEGNGNNENLRVVSLHFIGEDYTRNVRSIRFSVLEDYSLQYIISFKDYRDEIVILRNGRQSGDKMLYNASLEMAGITDPHYAAEVITKGDLADISLKFMDETYYSFTVRKNKDQLNYLQPQNRLSGNDNTEKTVNQIDFNLSHEPYYGKTSQTPDGFITGIRFFADNRMEMWDEEMWEEDSPRGRLRTGRYSVNNSNGLDFVTVTWSTGNQERFLFLTNNDLNDLYLYRADGDPFFEKISGFGNSMIFGNDSWIRASSSFRETIGGRPVVYSPEKLGIRIGECWVPRNEVNETLTLTISPRYMMVGDNLYFSSGFVSFSKPNLYIENSRIRRIRISDNSGNAKTVELFDTPHFQPVSLSGFAVQETVVLTIEILDVYPGSRYNDTCLNSIGWMFSQ